MSQPAAHHLQPSEAPTVLSVTAEQAGWRYLDVFVYELTAGATLQLAHPRREAALVPIEGRLTITARGRDFELSRSNVFREPAHVLYVPPDEPLSISALSDSCLSIGTAPAEGRYPIRLFAPEEMRGELRGGGAARRQVNHLLAAPLPAERLIVYEVVAPRGGWCGWPPHRHDGSEGSPYLEETYYFRFDRSEGAALHRNYRTDQSFDETFLVRHGDLVLVTAGYHTTVSTPGSNMYFLNFLAGNVTDADREYSPSFDQEHTWIEGDWQLGALSLPTPSLGRLDVT